MMALILALNLRSYPIINLVSSYVMFFTIYSIDEIELI